MGVLGALVGGSIGFMVGGPLGAILLGALGAGMGDRLTLFEEESAAGTDSTIHWGSYHYGRRPGPGTPPFAPHEAEQIYLAALISLAAKVAKVDGRVTADEIRSFDRFLRYDLGLGADERRVAARIFNQARDSSIAAEQFARQISDVVTDPDRLRDLVALLLKIAMADGTLAPAEERLIRSLTLAMGLTSRDFEASRALFGADTLDAAYKILGLDPSARDDQVKSAYRRLAREYHPDALEAKGVSEELRAFGSEKMVKINDAYRRIREARGL